MNSLLYVVQQKLFTSRSYTRASHSEDNGILAVQWGL